MNRAEAVALLFALPSDGGSLQPCEEANPLLARFWSRVTGREGGAAVWTEHDVAEKVRLLLIQHINQATNGPTQ